MPVALDPSAEGECTQLGEEKMAISFPFEFVDLGVPVPFVILPNPDFPTDTKPVCILENQGVPPGPDNFITTGALPFPNDPDPWSLTFRWATAGPPVGGEWQLDAFLEGISAGAGNITVPGLPSIIPGGSPKRYEVNIGIPAGAITAASPGVFLFRLYATLRWAELPLPPRVRVAGRAVGPLIEFYYPA
jgi:hypothetical protein